LELGTSTLGQKNYNDKATGPRKTFDNIFSRLDTIHERDGQTDEQTHVHWLPAKTALMHSKNDKSLKFKLI